MKVCTDWLKSCWLAFPNARHMQNLTMVIKVVREGVRLQQLSYSRQTMILNVEVAEEWVDTSCARVLQRERVLPLYSLVHV